MNILLAPASEQIVMRRMQSGQFQSPSEVIAQSLRLLEEQEALQEVRLDRLCQEIAIGIEQAERKDVLPFDAEELKQRVRQALQQSTASLRSEARRLSYRV